MKKVVLLYLLLCLAPVASLIAQQNTKPNILFIAVDDLKPELGCYGNKLIKTPNIDRLAKMGTVFLSNYCQQAVCGPTRASLMTGKRPDYTKVWDLKTKMREMNPDIVTLPQYLITQGYTTAGIGKIYHPTCVIKNDELSWSIPYLPVKPKDYAAGLELPAFGHYQSPELKKQFEEFKKTKNTQPSEANVATEGAIGKQGPATVCVDVPDNAYLDGAQALVAKDEIIKLAQAGKPFFMAVGYHKPHLPFVAPKKYWDLYNREDMPLAKFQEHSKNGPEIAYTNSGELRTYTDIPEFASFSDGLSHIGLKPEKQKQLIHGYYAAVSFTDNNVGILLNTLDSLGILKNTIIVLFGDHGWHLGDHDIWTKHTNFENATRAPLIIAAPGIKAGETKSLTEHLDIFPTICDLATVPVPTNLDGKSLVPIMKDNKATIQEYAISQYPRFLKRDEVVKMGYNKPRIMGYTLRTDRYRLVIWTNNAFTSKEPFTEDRVYAKELYDYKKDPLETVNVAEEKDYAAVYKDLHDKLVTFFKAQVNQQ